MRLGCSPSWRLQAKAPAALDARPAPAIPIVSASICLPAMRDRHATSSRAHIRMRTHDTRRSDTRTAGEPRSRIQRRRKRTRADRPPGTSPTGSKVPLSGRSCLRVPIFAGRAPPFKNGKKPNALPSASSLCIKVYVRGGCNLLQLKRFDELPTTAVGLHLQPAHPASLHSPTLFLPHRPPAHTHTLRLTSASPSLTSNLLPTAPPSTPLCLPILRAYQ